MGVPPTMSSTENVSSGTRPPSEAQPMRHFSGNPIVKVDITFQNKKREAKHRAETTVAWMLEHYEKKILSSKWATGGGFSALHICDENGSPLSSNVTLGELRDRAAGDAGKV